MSRIAAANATEAAPSPSFLSSGVVPRATPDTASGLCRPDGREAFMTICSIPGCDAAVHSRGWCNKHFKRWRRHGDPQKSLRLKSTIGAPAQYLADILSYKGDECRCWPFARDQKGYALIRRKGGTRRVIRIVCEELNGPPASSDLETAHSCSNGHLGCITPNHLRWATRLENGEDKVAHGRSMRGLRHPSAILTDEEALEIFKRASAGENQTLIAEDFQISRAFVSDIKCGRRKHWLTRSLMGGT